LISVLALATVWIKSEPAIASHALHKKTLLLRNPTKSNDRPAEDEVQAKVLDDRIWHQVDSMATGAALTVLDPKAAFGAEFVGENGRWSRPSGSFSAQYAHPNAAPSFNMMT
jgi:hypothetical protein